MIGKFKKDYGKVILISLLYGLVNLLIFFSYFDFLALWLDWNLFLAGLPLVFISLYKASEKKWARLIYLLLWLFFFPNAIYMVTDFIHLGGEVFYESQAYQTVYSKDMEAWLRLISIAFGFVLANYYGLESFYIFYEEVREDDKKKAYLLFIVVGLLTGLAIYIGRFLRFNSWDILRPLLLLSKLWSSLDGFAYSFIGLMTLYSWGLFGLFIGFRKKK